MAKIIKYYIEKWGTGRDFKCSCCERVVKKSNRYTGFVYDVKRFNNDSEYLENFIKYDICLTCHTLVASTISESMSRSRFAPYCTKQTIKLLEKIFGKQERTDVSNSDS